MAAPVTVPSDSEPIRPIRFAALQVPTFRNYWATSWISSARSAASVVGIPYSVP